MTTALEESAASTHHPEEGVRGPFEKISAAGCFVLNRTGDLLRVPEDALQPRRSPAMDIVSKDSWLVTRLSTDPYLPLNKARALAADMDLLVNF